MAEIKLSDMSAVQLLERMDFNNPPECIKRGESVEDAHRRGGKRDLILSYLEMVWADDTADRQFQEAKRLRLS